MKNLAQLNPSPYGQASPVLRSVAAGRTRGFSPLPCGECSALLKVIYWGGWHFAYCMAEREGFMKNLA